MRMLLSLIGLCAAVVSAIDITAPILNSTYAAGSDLTVEWTTVDTDPSDFSIYLVNFVYWPPSYVALSLNVPTADLAATVQIPCEIAPEWGYQINAINGTNVYIIYAQSDKFYVSQELDASTCVDNSTVATTCAAASTVYVTVSNTGSPSSASVSASASASAPFFSASASHTAIHSSSSLPSSSPPSSSSSSSSSSTSRYTKPGIVPKTIGWSSDYSHPVTIVPPTPTTLAPSKKYKKITSTVIVYTTVTATCDA